MKGQVVQINPRRGMVGIQTEESDCSIVELLGESIPLEVGDVVSWPETTPLGSAILVNHTRMARGTVFFQDHHVPPAHLRTHLLERPIRWLLLRWKLIELDPLSVRCDAQAAAGEAPTVPPLGSPISHYDWRWRWPGIREALLRLPLFPFLLLVKVLDAAGSSALISRISTAWSRRRERNGEGTSR